MIKDEIKMKSEDGEAFDKKQIALAIRNSTFNDELGCSLLEEGILYKCEGCVLKSICDGIDKVSEEYINETTKVVKTSNVQE
jgi:hypothetical protein